MSLELATLYAERGRTAGLDLIEAVSEYLRRAQFRPELRFEIPTE